MRLFTAVDLPADVLGRIETLLDQLRPSARINWSPVSNLHITTKFIGEWPAERLDELKSALAAAPPRPSIFIQLRKLGFFPNERAPRTFWCGIHAPGLAELAVATDQATAALGVPRESREFSPHLTLARIKERLDLNPLEQAMRQLPTLDFGAFEARSSFLYLSQLRPAGSVYTKLAEFPLSR